MSGIHLLGLIQNLYWPKDTDYFFLSYVKLFHFLFLSIWLHPLQISKLFCTFPMPRKMISSHNKAPSPRVATLGYITAQLTACQRQGQVKIWCPGHTTPQHQPYCKDRPGILWTEFCLEIKCEGHIQTTQSSAKGTGNESDQHRDRIW